MNIPQQRIRTHPKQRRTVVTTDQKHPHSSFQKNESFLHGIVSSGNERSPYTKHAEIQDWKNTEGSVKTRRHLSQDHISRKTTETFTNEHSARNITRSTGKVIRFRVTGKESFLIKSSQVIIKNTLDGHLKHQCWNITTKEHTVKKSSAIIF